jgi:hypothetical protein
VCGGQVDEDEHRDASGPCRRRPGPAGAGGRASSCCTLPRCEPIALAVLIQGVAVRVQGDVTVSTHSSSDNATPTHPRVLIRRGAQQHGAVGQASAPHRE